MNYREITKKRIKMGCEEIPRTSGGSHRKWYNSAANKIVPIPDWGNKDLKIGTLRNIIQQLDLDWEEFKRK